MAPDIEPQVIVQDRADPGHREPFVEPFVHPVAIEHAAGDGGPQ